MHHCKNIHVFFLKFNGKYTNNNLYCNVEYILHYSGGGQFQNFSENVKIIQGRFQDLKESYDCLVSCGNSFGLMDGGSDQDIVEFLGPEIMDRVQECILSDFLGEQSVGSCILLPISKSFKWLAHAPTMRKPGSDLRGSDHPYTVLCGVLTTIHRHNRVNSIENKIKTIVCFGMGVCDGRMDTSEVARLMVLAYSFYVKSLSPISTTCDVTPKYLINVATASMKHQSIASGGLKGFLIWWYKKFLNWKN